MSNLFATSRDCSIAYYVQGSGASTVLLVMGLGGRAADWGVELPAALGRSFRVVSVDNRGTGASTKPREMWTLEDMAHDALAVLDALAVERAHVVGISMGGMIAQLLALDHAERVDRLVLVSTHFGGPTVVHPGPEIASVFTPPRGTPVEEVMRSSLGLITAPGFAARHPESIEARVRLAVAAPTPKAAFFAQLQALLTSNRADRVKDIRAPTLVIHGDLDPLIPYENGCRLAERIPGARLETLRGCGHMPMIETTEKFILLVDDFLREGTSQPA